MLETLKNNVLEILFPTEESIVSFNADEKVKMSFFQNMTTYPKRRFLGAEKTKSELFTIIKGIIEDGTCRGLHPNWIIIFYQELIDSGYEFTDIKTDYRKKIMEFRNDSVSIRKQINETFKIHSYLLSDNIFKDIIDNNYHNLLVTNSIIESHVAADKIDNCKYIDIIYYMGDDSLTVPIEIQESYHHEESDIQRQNQIFALTGKKLVLYYLEDSDFDQIYDEIMESFSKIIMKLNKRKGISLYFTKVNKWDKDYSEMFSTIYSECEIKGKGYKVRKLIKYLKVMQLERPEEIINKMINSGDLIESHFKNTNNYVIEKPEGKCVNTKAYLNMEGVNRILQFPKMDEWHKSIEISNYYSQFMVKYIQMVEKLNTDNHKDQIILRNMYIETKNIFDMSNYLVKEFSVSRWEEAVKNKYLKNNLGNIKLHSEIPFLVRDKKSRIEIKRLEKLFGKDKVKKWTKKIETKKNILGYRQINSEELNEINKSLDNLSLETPDFNPDDESSDDESSSEIEDL